MIDESGEEKSEFIRLWIDNERKPPELYSHWAKTYDQAIKFLDTGKVVLISFDYDLGEEKNGYDILKYIQENISRIKKFHYRFHSSNIDRRNDMKIKMRDIINLWSKK